MILMVMDGQGGGIGASIIKRLRETFDYKQEIYALGTNSIATSSMMKAGANRGATGENAVVRTVSDVDIIIGPISIIMANAMMGELTPEMATAVSSCKAKKVLIPLSQEDTIVAGVTGEPLPHIIDQVVKIVKEMYKNV